MTEWERDQRDEALTDLVERMGATVERGCLTLCLIALAHVLLSVTVLAYLAVQMIKG